MGVLSEPEGGEGGRWARIARRWAGSITVLCALLSIVSGVVLLVPDMAPPTYFSENALLPGLVAGQFDGERDAMQFYRELVTELEEKYSDSSDMPVPWLVAKMAQINLEVQTHNFTLHYPLGRGQEFHGINVYGIVRAPRASGGESLLISAPYRPIKGHLSGTSAGIALMLAFAKFARAQQYWAKDLIFLITQHEQLGMEAWLRAYNAPLYSTSANTLDSGTLPAKAGAIQAGLNLEIETPDIHFIELKVEGLNGQLPNLDLVNVASKLLDKAGVPQAFHSSRSWVRRRSAVNQWKDNAKTTFEMLLAMLSGSPSGNHGLLPRCTAEAITWKGGKSPSTPYSPSNRAPRAPSHPLGFRRLGRALEATMRSLNNLLERFHQSYFFYLLLSTDRFLSIGQYMPCICLICAALLLRALQIWLAIHDEKSETADKKKIADDETEKKEESGDKKVKERDDLLKASKDFEISQKSTGVFLSVVLNIGILHLAGIVAVSTPLWGSWVGATYNITPENSVLATTILISLLFALFPVFVSQTPDVLKVLVSVIIATVLVTAALLNIAAAIALAIVLAPACLVASSVQSMGKYRKRLAIIICIICHPLMVMALITTVTAYIQFPEEAGRDILKRSVGGIKTILMYSVVDYYVYGTWTWWIAAAAWLPSWAMVWQLAVRAKN